VSSSLVVNEIYLSLQGESTFAGLPCIFVRMTACNLRCSYCDTAYAFTEGARRAWTEVEAEVHRLAQPWAGPQAYPITSTVPGHRLPLVEFTGGEPLLQPGSGDWMRRFCDQGFTVLVETSGAHDISTLDPRVRRIMDLKCPSSGEVSRNRWQNIPMLRATDEVKFVIGTDEDYQWACQTLTEYRLATICPILFSWVAPLRPEQQHSSLKSVPPGQTPLSLKELAERIVADALPVRFQLQQHKYVWPPDARGV
jgi:7-carboxy-7-deazaguanine synthase